MSPAPHADPQADAGLSFVFLPNRFLSDILSLLRGIVRVVLGGNACEKVIIAVLFNSRTNLFVRIDSYLFRQQENPSMISKEDLPACPVATTVMLIGNKWKPLIIRDLLEGTQRYSDFLRTIPGISQKVLTENLRSMESDGIIVRTEYPEVPPRVEYSLSELGETMRPILKSMEIWGNNYKSTFRNE